MGSETRSPTLLVRFLDSFLQERNIKWVLAVGMLVMLGSSALIVTTHWGKCTPVWKYLILLAYTAAIHGGGQWTYHRLGLRRTGTGLQGLTVLLIPILFLILHKTSAEGAIQLLLLTGTAIFGWWASWQIFTHFLRRPQLTFMLSYLALSIAGAIVPDLDPSWAPWSALALWAIFTIGTIKVNRHVFWLTEEHRQPRVFAFFPIALLGSQFLFLYCVHAAQHVALEWVGLGCVLVAIPVLATADAVARVFQQRTGDMVRPLPWAIVLPLIVGLVLCAAGVALAATGIVPPGRPRALVLTAASAAGLMALVARRTGKQAFVWAMLVAVTIAYQFSPAFFLDLARDIVDRGAHAVQEQKLPYAFYGLTYLPLLVALIVTSRRMARAGNELFAQPLRQYAIGLICILLGLSLTHEKAAFPVGICLMAISALHARLLRDWLTVCLAIVAWISAAYGFAPFVTRVLGIGLPADAQLMSMIVASGVLLVAGTWLDGWIFRILPSVLTSEDSLVQPAVKHFCQLASLLHACILAEIWLRGGVLFSEVSWTTGELLIGLLCIHGLRWPEAILSGIAIIFAEVVLLGLVARQVLLMPRVADSEIVLTGGTFLAVAMCELAAACRRNHVFRVWLAEALLLAGAYHLVWFHVFTLANGLAMFVILGLGILLWLVKEWARGKPGLAVLVGPLQITAFCMPLVTVGIGVYRHLFSLQPGWLGANSLALLLAAGFYFWRGTERQRKELILLAGVILNIALIFLWRELDWTDPQFFMVPIGISVLFLVELLKREIPERFHNPLRYLGALIILVSPTFHIVRDGSWVHIFSLMVASVAIVLVAIGLRVRALMYTGAAFLVADLAAMLVRGSIDNPNVLWIAGLLLGTGILALGAYCEKHRENLTLRMQGLAAVLREWK